MSENNKKDAEKTKDPLKDVPKEKKEQISIEQKLKETEDKLLRSLAEIENQRRRFEKKYFLFLLIFLKVLLISFWIFFSSSSSR